MLLLDYIKTNEPLIIKLKELNDNSKGYKALQYVAQKQGITASKQDIWDAVNFVDKYEDLSEFSAELDDLM